MALIDQQEAVEGVKELFSLGDCFCDEYSIVGMLNSLPTQEIIHCKDCKRFKEPSGIVNADWGWCSRWQMRPTVTFVKVDGFCHRAERRGEADDQ